MPDLIHQTKATHEPQAKSTSEPGTKESIVRNEPADATAIHNASWQIWAGIVLASLMAIAFLFAQMESFVNPLPSFPECAYCSSLKESLATIAQRWESVPVAGEELAAELDTLESAIAKQGATASRPSREADCLHSLVSAMDQRLNEFSRNRLERLTGFGSDDACPKLQELLALSERLKSVIKQTQHSLEKPTCEELLQWHSRFYSCSHH